MGNVLFVIIEIEYYQNDRAPSSCHAPLLWPMYFHLLFILVQTFFIFKGFSVSCVLDLFQIRKTKSMFT